MPTSRVMLRTLILAVLQGLALAVLDLHPLGCFGHWKDFRLKLLGALELPDAQRGDFGSLLSEVHIDPEAPHDSHDRCPLGEAAYNIAQLAMSDMKDPMAVQEILSAEWSLMRSVGWPVVMRAGWPLFRLLNMLVNPELADSTDVRRKCPSASPLLDALFSERADGSSLVPASLVFLAKEKSSKGCEEAVLASFLALVRARLPVFDTESEALLHHAQHLAKLLGLGKVLHRAPFVMQLLEKIEVAVQLAAKHEDDRIGFDVDLELVAQRDMVHFKPSCVMPSATTPTGHCNMFAPINRSLALWRDRGVHLEDVRQAFRPVTDQKAMLLRYANGKLYQVLPPHSHLDADFGSAEPACLAKALLGVLSTSDLPDFDLILNHGDLPVLRRSVGKPPFYGPMDMDARTPAPLFSICSSDDFWDLLFPNYCRPSLVNMSGMSPVPWHQKRKLALWRGTDRGAVNWAKDLRNMYEGSPRKRFLDTWKSDEAFNVAFLEDDLLNASVVNTDPHFIPLTTWPEWAYLLDLPGNGYSGSLKQKLTSSSAVLLLTDFEIEGAKPVYEHYHFGLQDRVHVLHINKDNAREKVLWAQKHDGAMRRISRNANELMSTYREMTKCYLWTLLREYSGLLRYDPAAVQVAAFGANLVVKSYEVKKKPRADRDAFRERCLALLEEHAA